MASNTPKLGLYMKDPVADGNDFFDVETMMNDNWEKIDGFAGGMDEVKERLNTISRQDVTLQPGVQIVNATKSALFQLSGLTGRMLVNLLGRMGNCENVGLWSSNTTIAVDTTNKTSGTSSFKLTLGSVPATASASFLTTPGRKYIAVADVKNGNTSKVAVSINGIAGATGNEVTSSSVFAPSVVRFAATDFFHIVTITGIGNSGSTFNMDSVRVYEVSEADYAAVATLTPAQVAAKWPYVDSVMPVRNPYAIRYGENLLPSFYEWTLVETKATEPYAAAMTPTVSNRVTYYEISTVPGNVYTLSAQHNGNIALSFLDSSGNVIGTPSYTTSQMVSGTAPANAQRMRVSFSNLTVTTGTLNISNPMLNIGSTEKPFKPREDSMLALQTDLYADPVTGANPDMVFERDGQYFKSKKWQGLTLDGALPWTYKDSKPGNKQVTLSLSGYKTDSERVIKYDGKLIQHVYPWTDADQSFLSAEGLFISIPVSDSGWADGYQPDQNDIKAYFYGYKAYDANTITPANAQASTTATWNGTGTKYWVQRVGAPNFTQSVPTQAYAGYTPYQLVYQLATPTVEPIVSEGQLSFVEGDNQVEVGTGVIIREKAKLYQELPVSGVGRWNINNGSPGEYQASLLNYRVDRFIGIYRNSQRDSWTLYPNTVTPAGALAQSYNVDTAAAYTVSYLAFMSSPVVPFTGSYAANEKTLLTDLVDSVQQNTARVSVLENKKVDKDSTPVRFYPTLINGWEKYFEYSPSFFKDSSGLVHLEGTVKNGIMDKAVFVLPKGFRPKNSPLLIGVASQNQNSSSRIEVGADGQVIVYNASAVWTNLSDVSFLAEQ
ncbi:hypothetical protein WGM54_03795 [Paenibacillus polymyxa]|uniref:hypothetical protein n=1 Tax=Paenibacillus polymyxa TaxID=1406 RepID=UPI00307DD0DA